MFAAAHREQVWTPWPSSTFLPRLPGAARMPFRIGLILVLVAMIVLAALRVNGPLGVTATIGWPLLFLLYFWQSDVFADLPLRILAVAMGLGITFGVGWWLLTGRLLARSYGVTTGSGLMLTGLLSIGLLVTAGGAVLMLVPAFVSRLFSVPARESLDGFVVGTFGALWYSTAATTTIVAPQFAEGLLEGQTADRMLHDALTYGVVSPIVSMAAGGLVGLALWFTPSDRPGRDPRWARRALAVCAVLGVALFLAAWEVPALGLPRAVETAVRLALAVLALPLIRSAVQIALLHERAEPGTADPVLCVHCDHVVPDLPFCSNCGAAAASSSQTSRRLRREHPPIPERVGQ